MYRKPTEEEEHHQSSVGRNLFLQKRLALVQKLIDIDRCERVIPLLLRSRHDIANLLDCTALAIVTSIAT